MSFEGQVARLWMTSESFLSQTTSTNHKVKVINRLKLNCKMIKKKELTLNSSTLFKFYWPAIQSLVRSMAGAEGIEPPNARTKTWCLTAWLRPNKNFSYVLSTFYQSSAGSSEASYTAVKSVFLNSFTTASSIV